MLRSTYVPFLSVSLQNTARTLAIYSSLKHTSLPKRGEKAKVNVTSILEDTVLSSSHDMGTEQGLPEEVGF